MWPFSNDFYALWNPLPFGTHEVGGLRDTVQPFNAIDGSGTGFSSMNLSWLLVSTGQLDEALAVYTMTKQVWYEPQEQAMTRDFSWDTASQRCNDFAPIFIK